MLLLIKKNLKNKVIDCINNFLGDNIITIKYIIYYILYLIVIKIIYYYIEKSSIKIVL